MSTGISSILLGNAEHLKLEATCSGAADWAVTCLLHVSLSLHCLSADQHSSWPAHPPVSGPLCLHVVASHSTARNRGGRLFTQVWINVNCGLLPEGSREVHGQLHQDASTQRCHGPMCLGGENAAWWQPVEPGHEPATPSQPAT